MAANTEVSGVAASTEVSEKDLVFDLFVYSWMVKRNHPDIAQNMLERLELPPFQTSEKWGSVFTKMLSSIPERVPMSIEAKEGIDSLNPMEDELKQDTDFLKPTEDEPKQDIDYAKPTEDEPSS